MTHVHVPTTRSSHHLDGVEIAAEVGGTGPPVLLVAGTGYPGATWSGPFLDALRRQTTVIVYDHRGTGASHADGPYSTRRFADDAIGLLASLGVRTAHVLGHSMGGRVAQWMALDAPERVSSLILAASGPGQFRADRPLTRGIPVVTAEKLIEQGYQGYMSSHIRNTFFTPAFVAERPDVVAGLVAAFWDHRPTLRNYLEHITARQQHQTAEHLAEIRAPALVLVGDHDTGSRGTGSHLEQSSYLHDHLPHARLETIAGTSHGFIWQKPGPTADIVADWIAAHEPS